LVCIWVVFFHAVKDQIVQVVLDPCCLGLGLCILEAKHSRLYRSAGWEKFLIGLGLKLRDALGYKRVCDVGRTFERATALLGLHAQQLQTLDVRFLPVFSRGQVVLKSANQVGGNVSKGVILEELRKVCVEWDQFLSRHLLHADQRLNQRAVWCLCHLSSALKVLWDVERDLNAELVWHPSRVYGVVHHVSKGLWR